MDRIAELVKQLEPETPPPSEFRQTGSAMPCSGRWRSRMKDTRGVSLRVSWQLGGVPCWWLALRQRLSSFSSGSVL